MDGVCDDGVEDARNYAGKYLSEYSKANLNFGRFRVYETSSNIMYKLQTPKLRDARKTL
jgi:hypothetical protein